MKTLRHILLLLAVASSPLLLADDNTTPAEQSAQQAPDFSPPKDLNGPVFPPEEFIKKPDSAETNKFITEFISTIATLGLIISLILIFAYFLKRMVNTRMEQANNTSGIRIAERRMISPKTAIYLIEVEGKGIIIAETATGVTHLSDYPLEGGSNTNPPQDSPPSTFSKLLDSKKSSLK